MPCREGIKICRLDVYTLPLPKRKQRGYNSTRIIIVLYCTCYTYILYASIGECFVAGARAKAVHS